MNLNHLPNDLLLKIFSYLPLPSLLPLELVCPRWRFLQEFLLCRHTTLVLLGPTSPHTHATTPLQLIQKSTQRYSVSVSSSAHHVTLSRRGLTFKTCEFLLRKLPNITRLELVQVSLVSSVDLVVFLLNGWNLETFKVLHDELLQFNICKIPGATANSRRMFQKNSKTSKTALRFTSCLHTLLSHLTPSWQPYLRHLTLVTFDNLTQKEPTFTFDLSQLTAFHIIRPWETNRLLPQILLSSHPSSWSNLTKLTLYSDGNFSQLIRDYYDTLRPIFRNLHQLSLNFTTRTVLSLITQNCSSLSRLHLGCVTLPFVDLALELEPLQFQLTHLKLTFPYTSLDPAFEWSPIESPDKVPLFITVRHLHLAFSTLLHNPALGSGILEHLFPKLETLILDRNKADNAAKPGVNCVRCSKMRCITAFACKHNLVRALREGRLARMRRILVQVEAQFDESKPSALETYEVYDYKEKLWTIHSTAF